MKFAMIGAVLITLPAICGLIYGLVVQNWALVGAAVASFALNTLPFIAAGLLMKRSGGGGSDLGH
jgi:ABC-type bacteriocin/lantibiotic exporter with double-glycine peptidase domain